MSELSRTEQNQQPEINLREMLSYENPNMDKYKELISDVEKKTKLKNWDWDTFQSGIGETIFDRGVLNPGEKEDQAELQNLVLEKLANNTLIELGGRAYFPKWYRVKTHISVNRYAKCTPNNNDKVLSDPFSDVSHDFQQKNNMRFVEVPADMLDFVARLPDNSADNFFMAGIDGTIIPNEEYMESIMEEMARAVKPGGLIFGGHWPGMHWKHPDFIDVTPKSTKQFAKVYRKLTEEEKEKKL